MFFLRFYVAKNSSPSLNISYNRRLFNSEKRIDQLANSVQKPSLWTRVKNEAKHYYHGSKLLVQEIKISTRLVWKMNSTQLTRREKLQLTRTSQDLLRLVPFSVFIIVPFMEFLLPFALKLFPNMLPSTFSDQKTEEERKKKIMAAKLEYAKFLRKSLSEINTRKKNGVESHEFSEFFKTYRLNKIGTKASTTEILSVCKKFSDDITLGNLSRPQLVTMCRFMGVGTFGTENFLRYSLRQRMAQIKRDDKMIQSEGIDSLSTPELISACQTRGIRTETATRERLIFELQQWLDLNTLHEIPSALMILTRALMMTDQSIDEALQNTLASLPDDIVEKAEMKLRSEEVKESNFEEKLALIKEEEQKIKTEEESKSKEKKKLGE